MTGWLWAAARNTGTSHVAGGIPCQDAVDCTVWACSGEPPVLIAALADGAGSAACAEHGSRLAVSLFVDFANQAFTDGATMADAQDVMRHACLQARLSIALVAGRDARPVADFASTLLMAIVSSERAAFGQIGDGAIVVRSGPDTWNPVFWPMHGEYANTTDFLTDATAPETLMTHVVAPAPTRFAMFSDGLERMVLDFRGRTAHAPFFETLLGRLCAEPMAGHATHVSEDLALLLGSQRITTRTDDDTSLFCAALTGA